MPLRLPFAILFVSLACTVHPAVAGDDDHERARDAVRRGEILSLDELLRRVELRPGEQLLEVEVERDDGLWIYELELIGADGRVRELEVDARDGRILEDD